MTLEKASLSEGLRNIFYTPNAAIADIIDNSLDAKAKNIDINFWNGSEVYIAIIDDGHGMSKNDLENAINFKKSKKLENSLGKFGWGLKTATFSQASLLTIVTKKNDKISFINVDKNLNHVETNLLKIFNKYKNLEKWFNNRASTSGTAVIWSELKDNILGTSYLNEKKRAHEIFYAVGLKVSEYASMCFHSFLDNTNIYFNDQLIPKVDPFKNIIGLKKYPVKEIVIDNSKIIIGGVLFPKEDDIANEKLYEELSCFDGWHDSQGVYIYRENRLIDWGGWFELKKNGRDILKREEKFKRCRIYLKYESQLDHIFTPNVQKSKSDIPHYLRHQIAEYCDQIRNDASKITRTKSNSDDIYNNKNIEESLVEQKNHNILIKHDHPLIEEFLDKNWGKTKKEYLLEKLLNDLKKEYKKDEGFFRKLFSG